MSVGKCVGGWGVKSRCGERCGKVLGEVKGKYGGFGKKCVGVWREMKRDVRKVVESIKKWVEMWKVWEMCMG